MTITAPPATSPPVTYVLPGLSWLSLAVDGSDGTLTVGPAHVPVHVVPPVGGSPARVEADLSEVTLAVLSAAAVASGSPDPLAALPASLATLVEGVAITAVGVSIDTSARQVTGVDLHVVAPGAWAVVPGAVDVADAMLTIGVTRSGAGTAFDVALTATVGGSAVALAVAYDDPTTYAVTLTATGAPVGLAAVAGLFGGDLSGHLPGPLSAVGGVGLTEATVTIASGSVALVAATLSSGSPVVLPAPIGLTVDHVVLQVTVTDPSDPVTRTVAVRAEGDATLAGAALLLRLERSVDDPASGQWTLSGGLVPGATLTASAVAAAYGATLPPALPDLAISQLGVTAVLGAGTLTVTAASPTLWSLPIGVDGIAVGDLAVTFTRHAADADGRTVGGSVTGVVHLGGIDVPVTYTVPGGLTLQASIPELAPFRLLGDLCGATALAALALPPEVVALAMTDIDLSLDVERAELSFAATGPGFKRVQAVVRKGTAWGFAVGIELDDTYRFSSLSPALGGLDSVHLPDALIVVSTFDDTGFTFEELQPAAGTGIARGLLIDGRLDLSGLGADTFLGESHLDVTAHVGSSLSDLSLAASVGDIRITDGVVLKNGELELVPDPENISLRVSGAVDVTVDASPLEFIGGVKVVPNGISFFATMKGTWQDPFGAKGVALTDVSLEIGSDFEGVPSIGIAGGLTVGAFTGNAAVAFNSQLPSQSVLIVAFNHLSLLDVVDTFCPASVTAGIPADVHGTLAGVSLENVDLYVVPQDTTIGALTYKQGLRVGGTLHVAGFTATGNVEIDPADGVVADGSLSPVHVGDTFSLTGTGTDPAEGPSLHLAVNATSVPTVAVDGQVSVLGLTAAAHVDLTDAGFELGCRGAVFGLFDADVSVEGGSLQSGAGFVVHADLHQSFLADLARRAATVLQQAGADATAQLAVARHSVDAAQADVARLGAAGDAARGDLAAAQADARSRIQGAQDQVVSAQSALAAVTAQIGATRADIQAQRDAAATRLQAAQAALSDAQATADSLTGQVNAQQAQIDRLNSDIAWWNSWYDNLAWYDKTWGWTQLGAEVGWRGTQVAGLTLSIAALRGSAAVADGVLQGARQAVQAAQAATAAYPVDQDPRILSLQATWVAAQAALQTAQGVLTVAQQTTAAAVTAASRAVDGLVQQLGQATVVLHTTSTALGQLQQAVGAVADVAGYVAAHGLGALLDVRSASFDGALSTASGGSVTLAADVVFQGVEQAVTVAYDFHDLAASAEAFARQVLPSLAG